MCIRFLVFCFLLFSARPLLAQTYSPEEVAVWLDHFRGQAMAQGVSGELFDRAFDQFSPNPKIIASANYQPEFTQTPGEYVSKLVSDLRILEGQRHLSLHAALLEKLERLYGVDRHILIAIWGVETNYGKNTGGYQAIEALATLAVEGTRRNFAERQLLVLLSMLEKEKLPVDITSSWAGAMGQMQFIPTTYADYARDVDGDGTRDIWHSLEDSLGSAAYYLKRSGWKAGLPWGFEIILPETFDEKDIEADEKRSLEEWREDGFTAALGKDARHNVWDKTPAKLLRVKQARPSFLITKNFDALLKYNNSNLYALAIGYLADRLRGGSPTHIAWLEKPLPQFTKEEIKITQTLLSQLGFDAGKVDGIIGQQTYQALHGWQASAGIEKGGLTHAQLVRLSRETLELSLDEIKRIQQKLTSLGYDSGVADGLYGKKTRNALRAWQEKSGFAANGHPDRAMLAALTEEGEASLSEGDIDEGTDTTEAQ